MDRPTTPIMSPREPGAEIETKHKEAIRQLYKQAHLGPETLAARYDLGVSTINRILRYDKPERARPSRKGKPFLLDDTAVNSIIEYLSDSYHNRTLDWAYLVGELSLECSAKTLERRLKQRGYFRCVACQKSYLTPQQVYHRFLWSIKHIFWHDK